MNGLIYNNYERMVKMSAAATKYDLAELLKNPRKPLTREQFENFDKYLRFTNDDKSAKDVDISDAADDIIERINKNGVCWC
jgi:oligoendopeptidase F